MRESDVFVLAERAMVAVVERIEDRHWDIEVPKAMKFVEGQHTVRDTINHFARDSIWVPDVLAGKTIEEVGDKYNLDHLGDEPKTNFSKIGEVAIEAVRGFDDFDKIVHLIYGDYPARDYLQHIIVLRGFGAYDIPKVIDVEPNLPPALVQGMWDVLEPQAEALRELGMFGAKVDVPEDAPLQDRLLGLSGRDPRG